MPPNLPSVSDSTIRRLSLYLRVLEELNEASEPTVSSRRLAELAGTSAAQVRKDLSRFGSFGKRGLGYAVDPLERHLREILGLQRRWPVVLVGAGRIGSALFEYPYFRERGFEIVAVVDRDPAKVGRRWNGVKIEPVESLSKVVRELGTELGILAIPADDAQATAEALVNAGIRGILNFAPVQLHLRPEIVVNEVNLTLELEALSFALHGSSRATSPERD